ncbi:MAG: prepilin-type N-terminal cleavage/methylation domain-containing protein [Desulfosarcina sp.]|jgi:prepilin-type N-terminal cleavage/methylation domain-containing protein
MIKNQKGFTLVEIAIVLVIIGLLIGGVLKGQAMIQNAKTKRVVKSADELRAGIYTYYDKYGVYPGDESSATTPPNDTHDGNGDGQISAAEADQAFEDLALAGILTGNFDGDGLDSYPRHAFGDIYQVYWVNPGGGADHFIRYDNLPWDVAQEIDTKYDDGVFNTGNIRANEDYVSANSPVGAFYMPL